MRMIRLAAPCRLVAVVALLCATPPVALAAPYHGETYGYHVVLPDDWVQIADADVKATADAARNPNAKNVVVFDTAFQPSSHVRPFQYPYVIVQVIPYADLGLRRQVNEDEFADVVKAMTGA